MAPIKTIKVLGFSSIAYCYYAAFNSVDVTRRWFLQSAEHSDAENKGFFCRLFKTFDLFTTPFDLALRWYCIPEPYKNVKMAINEVTDVLKKLASYEWICDDKFNAQAIRLLELYEKTDEPEILWRLGRACVERSLFLTVDGRKISQGEKAYYIEKAFELNQKALAKGDSAGAHKWYAITLITLLKDFKPCKFFLRDESAFRHILAPNDGNVNAEIIAHLEKAVELDPKDLSLWYILGTQYKTMKEAGKAAKCFEKAGDIKVAI